MFKFSTRRLSLLLWGIVASSLFLCLQAPLAHADSNAQVKITQPMVNGMAVGHPGTKVAISGSGFTPGSTINLYTTANGDPTKCTANGDPAANGLTPFNTSPAVTAQGDGSFTLNSTWPDSASTPQTAYYICAISQQASAISSNTFTVASPVAINVAPSTVPQGGQVTVTGSNWLPPQPLNVSIVVGQGNTSPIVSQTVTSNPDGSFSTTLTIPANAQAGTYTVRVYATNETSMSATQNNGVTVTQVAAPTVQPTAAPATTPVPTTQPTTTPAAPSTPTPASTGGSGLTMIIYTLGGIGMLLVVIGIILFIISSR